MTQWYNMSINANTPLNILQSVNNNFMNHFFGAMILIVLFIIMYRGFIMYNNNPKISIMFSFFFIAILSIIFKLLDLANDLTLYLCWIFFGISVIVVFFTE